MKEYQKILKKNGKASLALSVLMVVCAAVSVVTGYSLSWILNSYEAAGNRVHHLLLALLASLSLFVFDIVLEHCAEIFQFKMQHIIKNDLREMVSNKIVSLPYDEFHKKDSGAYVSWLGNDVDRLYTNCFQGLFTGIERMFSAIFAFVAMAMNSWYLGAAALILFAIQFILPQLCNKVMERAEERRSKAMEVSVESYKDTIMGAGILYLSNLRQRITERIVKSSDTAERQVFESNRVVRRVKSLILGINMNNQLVLMGIAVFVAITGAAPIGIAFAVGNLCGQFFNGIEYVVQAAISIRATKPLWEKFAQQETEQAGKQVLEPISEIEMQNLSFAYGDRVILDNRNFSFQAGEKYAICGESGSGKTTVTKLLMGLLPDYQGDILYNGLEQKQVDSGSLYNQIAYIDQQVYLFQDTLRFNITLGQPYSDEEIMSVLNDCKLKEFVDSLPDGLDSMIDENGKNLSGGQRQRIALARGLIRNVRYVVLDEGTSALDEENAVDIEQNLMKQQNLCVIIITHNLRDCIRKQLTGVYTI